MDDFERLEAGLSRENVQKKSLGRQAADTLLGCFIQRDDGTEAAGGAGDEIIGGNKPFEFRQEPIAAALLASTQVVFDTLSGITNGLASLFISNKTAAAAAQEQLPFEVIIDAAPQTPLASPESPRMALICGENSDDRGGDEKMMLDTVDDYDGTGFWEEHLDDDDSFSETGSCYGIESYIDTSKDNEIVMQPIARKSPRKASAKVTFEPILAFMNSAVINDRITIKAYLQNGRFDINVRDQIGYTLLHYASAHGHADLVKFLLDQGAEINLPEPEGWTALHFAAIAEQVKVCKVLIEKGANVECPNSDGITPAELTDNGKIRKMIEDAIRKKLSAKKVTALYDWNAESAEEDLSIKRGQVLKVKERHDAWWLVQDDSKNIGLVPRIFVQ